MNAPLLEVCELSCSYPGKALALKGVSAVVHPGERIAILGGNGAGKSTFFLALTGVLSPTSGRIFLNGEEITRAKASRQRLHAAVGMVFQEPDNQLIAPTVEAEVSFGPMNLNLSHAEVGARVEESLVSLEIEPLRARPPHMLSGGEKKRVTIADVLAMRPSLMLLDEPTASLDATGLTALEKILAKLHSDGLAVMLSTHDLNLAWRWADRVMLFHEGELAADAAPEAIFNDEALLSRVGLGLPHVFQVSKALARRGLMPSPPSDGQPRSISDLERLLANL